jgi:UbiA prenyltransferase family protein
MSTLLGRLGVYLRLGRVSNLPTVWSNVLAGMVLAGGAVEPGGLAGLLLSLSLFYVAGMFLNDGFDRSVDARERPERPIPAGLVGAGEVFALGFGMLALAVLLVVLQARRSGVGSGPALWAGLALAGAIVLYDVWHKDNPASPLVMGSCRMLIYVTAAATLTGRVGASVVEGALVLLCYLIGLTYAAKQERRERVGHFWPLLFLAVPFVYVAPSFLRSPVVAGLFLGFLAWVGHAVSLLVRRPPRVPRAVVSFIAGISLLDALLIAVSGRPELAGLAALAFPATLILQRYVRGT